MSIKSYVDIFQKRGLQFAEACRLYAPAIASEANTFLAFSNLNEGETVLDAPAAGAFLSRYLKEPNISLIALDPCPALSELASGLVKQSWCAPLSNLPFQEGHFDAVLCLAGLHHELALAEFFIEAFRVIKPNGRLVIAEVDEKSAPAEFLNGFVNAHSSLGHQGLFFSQHYIDSLKKAGFVIDENQYKSYHWVFESNQEMADAIAMMFGIDRATPEQTLEGIKDILGTENLANGYVGMRWGLRFISCIKKLGSDRAC